MSENTLATPRGSRADNENSHLECQTGTAAHTEPKGRIGEVSNLPRKFRKKPVVIEAVQITDSTFAASHPNPEHIQGVFYNPVGKYALVKTLEGTMRANLGDWIICGVQGELYPCKPDVFEATYEPVT